MIYRVVLLIFLLFNMAILHGAEVTIKPQGEYATINVKADNDYISVLQGKNLYKKARVARKIEGRLGDYNPVTLVALGKYYLEKKNIHKAVIFIRLGILRAAIDIKASQDLSLDGVLPTLYSFIQSETSKLSPNEIINFSNIFKSTIAEVIALDRKTPRNYDIRWASLHSSGAFTNRPLNYVNQKRYNELVNEEYKLFNMSSEMG